MIKKYFQFTVAFVLILISLFAVYSFSINAKLDEQDYNACLKKYESKWGEPCLQCTSYNDSYRISLRNTCKETLDVKCAVQESDKKWRSFTKLSMAPNDTMIAYACKGLGKYLTWAKKSGDATAFPTDEEINKEYNK